MCGVTKRVAQHNIREELTYVACKGSGGDDGGFRSKGHNCEDLSAVDLISHDGDIGIR